MARRGPLLDAVVAAARFERNVRRPRSLGAERRGNRGTGARSAAVTLAVATRELRRLARARRRSASDVGLRSAPDLGARGPSA